MKIDKDKLINIILIIIAAALAIILYSSPNAQAAPENITITDPTNDPNNDPVSSDFQITVRVTDPDVQRVQAKIIGQTFISLSQIDSFDWQGVINISGVQSGNYQLTARYYNNTGAYFYIQQTTPITIQKPTPTPTPSAGPTPVQYGSILMTITDSNNQPISGARAVPSGNTTDSSGNVFIGQQPLNQYINFTISKTGYNTTYHQTTFTSNQTVSLFLVMHMVNGDTSQFDVTGYEGMEAGRGVFVTVKDRFTGAKVENAQIIIYDGATVKSSPGQTINGRLFVSAPADVRQGQYLLEVTRPGYEDFTDTFTIFVPKLVSTPSPTPTPTPSPTTTPAPTPERKYWSDSMQMMTEDEHSKWLSDSNLKNLPANNGTAPATKPQEESTFPWTILILSILLATGVAYRLKPEWFHKKQEIKEANAASTDEMLKAIESGSVDDVQPVPETIKITCPLCKVPIATVGKGISQESREQILNEHLIKIHEEDPETITKYKQKPTETAQPSENHMEELEKAEPPREPIIIKETVQDRIEKIVSKRQLPEGNGNGNNRKKRSKCQYCSARVPPKSLPAHELNCELNPVNQSAEG